MSTAVCGRARSPLSRRARPAVRLLRAPAPGRAARRGQCMTDGRARRLPLCGAN